MVTPDTIPSPMCIYEPPCGHQAALGEAQVVLDGRCIHHDVRCLHCGRDGVLSLKVQDGKAQPPARL